MRVVRTMLVPSKPIIRNQYIEAKAAGGCFASEDELERYGRKFSHDWEFSRCKAMDRGFGAGIDGNDGSRTGDAAAAAAGRACEREHCGRGAGCEEGCGAAYSRG